MVNIIQTDALANLMQLPCQVHDDTLNNVRGIACEEHTRTHTHTQTHRDTDTDTHTLLPRLSENFFKVLSDLNKSTTLHKRHSNNDNSNVHLCPSQDTPRKLLKSSTSNVRGCVRACVINIRSLLENNSGCFHP